MDYLPGTPKEGAETWSTEWFYITDVPLEDPIRQGLPPFSHASLKKRYNWRSRSPSEEDDAEVSRLAAQIFCLGRHKLTISTLMAVAMARGVQPLQQCVHPLWEYNGSYDSTRAIRKGYKDRQSLAAALEAIYKGKKRISSSSRCVTASALTSLLKRAGSAGSRS